MEDDKNFRILIIDDNPAIHQDFLKILKHDDVGEDVKKAKAIVFGKQVVDGSSEKLNFIIDSAYQGEEGLIYVAKSLRENKPYALMFVDVRMPPGWDGIETIRKIWEIDSEIQAVICTAHFDYTWSEMIKKLNPSDRLLILKKPFDNVEILQFASSLTKKWNLQQQVKNQIELLNDLVQQRTKELKKSLSITRATLESTTDGIVVVSNAGEIIDYNQKFVKIWQIPSEVLTKKMYDPLLEYISSLMISPQHFLEKQKDFDQQSEIEFYQEVKLKNGRILECFNLPHKIDELVIGRVISFRDVTEDKRLEEQLQHLATYDTLTELPNRTLLLDRIEQAISTSIRTKKFVAILFIDLDQFKTVNDSLGHSIGDELLKDFARRFMHVTRTSDTMARFGGDEFVMVLTQLNNEEDVIPIAQNLLNLAALPFTIQGHELRLTCSIGISIYPINGKNAENLLKNADLAMYRVKVTGRNNFEFYTKKMNVNVVRRLQLKTNLFKALENNEFCLYYQPIFDLNTHKIISTEVLLRWQHPNLGLLLPDEFINIAEEIGLIIEIGEWVLKTACMQNKEWQDNHIAHIPIAVNLSSFQVHHSNFREIITRVLAESNLDPKFLELEITESIIINDTEAVIKTLNDIQKISVKFIIDDFGTGYSSLSYLRRLPIAKLKIDRSFIKNIKVNNEDDTVIIAIINLAHNLNLKVIGEGIESKKQVDFLAENKCDEVQGYYFCKPLPANQYEEFLKGGT